jgi:expansin (peptidoglycan-binding protein)
MYGYIIESMKSLWIDFSPKRLVQKCRFVAVSCCFFLPVHSGAEVDDGTVLHQGEATFYGENAFGHCGFLAQEPQYHGAMNHTDYDTAAACGTWVNIAGPSGEVTAFIDDECPECKPGDIDLGPNTFAKIGDLGAGRIPITWRYVPMVTTAPIQYHWQSGSSQWHIAVQVLNHSYGIIKLEIKTATSTWVEVPRQVYNYFVLPGGIDSAPGPYSIRITDIHGIQLTDNNLTITPGQNQDGAANFPVLRALDNDGRVRKQARCSCAPITTLLVRNRVILPTNVRIITADAYSIDGKKIGAFFAEPGGLTIPGRSMPSGSAVIVVVPRAANR